MDFNRKSQLYCQPFQHAPSQEMMLNVKTTLLTTEINGYLFPVTINEQEYESSYVCSPYNALITYSKDELVKINSRILRFVLNLMIAPLGGWLRWSKINKNVCINNFLLSTNPYPNWKGEQAEQQLEHDLKTYPDYAFVYRSLNHHTNRELIKHLQDLGFILVPSRQVYMFDVTLCDYLTRNNTQNDRRALGKNHFQKVTHDEISENDYPQIVNLYNLLYVEKYSQHNPQFSEKLIKHWHQNTLLTFFGLRDTQGVLQGVVGLFESDEVITAPLVGYNTHLPHLHALYRILIYIVLDYSHKKKVCLNLSSGASQFKILRGGQPFIEYSAIYIKHLPLYRRISWNAINRLLRHVFVPILKRYKL